MRYSSEHKARTRERILHVAAAAIRAHGIGRVSLSDIMAGANLTNGGFYAHFDSKDDLIAEAIGFMFDERYGRFLEKVNTSNAKQALTDFINRYLSMRHRDSSKLGCPIPALAPDVPHISEGARMRFSAGVSRLTDGLATLLECVQVADPQVQARSMLAELAGALALARTEGPTRAREILLASRYVLKRRLGLVAGA